MAQPQQYAGLGGAAPAPGAEGTDSYRETFRAEPFAAGTGGIAATQTFIPGRENEVVRTPLACVTRADRWTGYALPPLVPGRLVSSVQLLKTRAPMWSTVVFR